MSDDAVEEAWMKEPGSRITNIEGVETESWVSRSQRAYFEYAVPTAVEAAIREDAVREWREAFADYIDARLGVIHAETIDDRVSTMTRHAEAFTAIRALLDREKEG